MRVRHENRRKPGRRKLPDRAACTGENEIGRTVGGTDLVREREETIVGSRDPLAKVFIVPLAADMEDGGSACSPAVHRELVQPDRALAASEYEQHRSLRR